MKRIKKCIQIGRALLVCLLIFIIGICALTAPYKITLENVQSAVRIPGENKIEVKSLWQKTALLFSLQFVGKGESVNDNPYYLWKHGYGDTVLKVQKDEGDVYIYRELAQLHRNDSHGAWLQINDENSNAVKNYKKIPLWVTKSFCQLYDSILETEWMQLLDWEMSVYSQEETL